MDEIKLSEISLKLKKKYPQGIRPLEVGQAEKKKKNSMPNKVYTAK